MTTLRALQSGYSIQESNTTISLLSDAFGLRMFGDHLYSITNQGLGYQPSISSPQGQSGEQLASDPFKKDQFKSDRNHNHIAFSAKGRKSMEAVLQRSSQ